MSTDDNAVRGKHHSLGQETDLADQYRSEHRVGYQQPNKTVHNSINVLEFLIGMPWNNHTLNWVAAVRPSCLRVVGPGNYGVTCDSVGWRVTIVLDKDDRTIKRITQEVDLGGVGAIHGHDLSMQLAHYKKHGTMDGYDNGFGADGIGVINQSAIKNIVRTENDGS